MEAIFNIRVSKGNNVLYESPKNGDRYYPKSTNSKDLAKALEESINSISELANILKAKVVNND